jgi:hypothetical protein
VSSRGDSGGGYYIPEENPEIRYPKSEIRYPKSEIRYLKSEIRLAGRRRRGNAGAYKARLFMLELRV